MQSTLVQASSRTKPANRLDSLRHRIEHAAHLLPAQGPITAFVHHNTLHAFEDMPFEQAVIHGGRTFGCLSYLPELRYREQLARGRIRAHDIEAALIEDLGDRADQLLGFLGTRFHLRRAMLQHPWRIGPTAELRWVVEETDALWKFREETPASLRDRVINDTRHWFMRDLRNGGVASSRGLHACDPHIQELVGRVFERFEKSHMEHWTAKTWEAVSLHMLWLVCHEGVRHAPARQALQEPPLRHRGLLLQATGQDSDQRVHDVLIRFCAAFLDQGFGDWTLPGRAAGFYRAFIELYGGSFVTPDRWLRGLPRELKRIETLTPLESVDESLGLLGVSDEESDEFITQTLLALRGFAGMIWQMETRGDRAAHPAPPGSLVEYLAVRLVLERCALEFLARETIGFRGPLRDLRDALRKHAATPQPTSADQRAFLVFQLAQLLGWTPQTLYKLPPRQWSSLVAEIESFSGLDRRRVFHLAFERRYRIQTLDAVAVHCRQRQTHRHGPWATDGGNSQNNGRRAVTPVASSNARHNGHASSRRPAFQVICCIDEREESFRRHLEEVAPHCETFGAAGFFAAAMYYRGAADAHYTPLCPVVITPRHYVREHVVYTLERSDRRRRKRRRAIGTVTRQVHVGSRTFAGGWLAAVLGSLASIPLVIRILLPRLTAQLRRLIGGFVRTPAITKLQLEREQESPGSENGHIGYSIDEMGAIVERLLRDVGLTGSFSRIVVVCGHGSSSLNNPHEAAHDCGACGGGRGGPNARAFAQMANDPRVRAILLGHGLEIPQDTVFIGSYHNTCDDSMTYYDLDRLPSSHTDDFERASDALDTARERSAHERCRRFETAELGLSTEAALRHVEGRAEDLSQVRPEYGHATNALCFVGRRDWSRGLFLDRRAFLQSYDPSQDDPDHTVLTRVLQAVVPVCAGINLEYFFSYVDPIGYGCGTKLPHNIASLLGVMNGAASDLRPGLPWQMVEIHEPVRLLFVVETTPDAMLKIMERNEGIAKLVYGRWVQLATLDPATSEIHLFRDGAFSVHRPHTDHLPEVVSSIDWYRGWRDHLEFASVISPHVNGAAVWNNGNEH